MIKKKLQKKYSKERGQHSKDEKNKEWWNC